MGLNRSVIEELKQIYLFDALSDPELERVAQTMISVRLEHKQALFEFGQPADRFYYVRSGQIKLFRLSPDGEEKVIEIIHPGQTFAEAIMFMEKKTYPVSSEAIQDAELYSFDMGTFRDLLRNSPQSCLRLMGSMSMRLRARVEEINNLTLQNATYRLVTYLLNQIPDADQSPAIHLSTPKGVIASRLSIQPETLSRIFNRLSRQGLLSVQGSDVIIHDLAGLRALL